MKNVLCLSVLALLLTLPSCTKEEDEPTNEADIEITVTRNGNPAVNELVGIYNSQADAIARTNLLKSTQNTNNSGKVSFYFLTTQRTYWINAGYPPNSKVKETPTLAKGINAMSVSIN
ncbi:MAG: hypothetical protein RIC15_02955 [Vicingaceae bacterium]